MENYPKEYVEHNLPLVLLSGLGGDNVEDLPTNSHPFRESGTRIQGSSPECNDERAQAVLQQFLLIDGSSQPWNSSTLPGPSGKLKFKMQAVGRVGTETYTLPPRKAAPLAHATSSDGSQTSYSNPAKSAELHSPLSPLSPGSPLYPNGVFTPLWLAKHQQQVPAVFIAFFNISATVTVNGNQDEQLKSDINAIRASINRSGFKTKLAAVLISDRSVLQAPELEDRMLSIRRATSLDAKSGLFFIPPMSTIEVASFVLNMLTALQPLCIDYYRDLTKHARRKKTRISSGSSLSLAIDSSAHPLSSSGWNIRYEVKQGVFAEFRQEMETAERHYIAAMDELFSVDGILEFYPVGSPRWMEARLLSDCLALRILRCELWVPTTSAAVHSWVNYKHRVQDLIDRRGKALQTYGWEAWKSRWAEIMAQLVNRAELPIFMQPERQQDRPTETVAGQIYATPEKAMTAVERLPPFHHLHHPGYWHLIATTSSRARRDRALEISEEDRVPPWQSPASSVARRKSTHGYYLVPDPHEESPLSEENKHDHVSELTRLTEAASKDFESKSQTRMAELVRFDLARDLAQAERFDDAIDILVPLWNKSTWRADGWQPLLAELLLLLRLCAGRQGNADLVVGTTYELLSTQLPLPDDASLDLSRCLDHLEGQPEAVSLKIHEQDRLCPLAVSFTFETKETHVGESLGCQLSLVSCMNKLSAHLTLSSVKLFFGSSKTLEIIHDANDESESVEFVTLSEISKNEDGSLRVNAGLTFLPKARRIFNFSLTFREPQIIRLTRIVLSVRAEAFSIEHAFTDYERFASDSILVRSGSNLERRELRNAEPTGVAVLPKPPKVQILIHGLRKEYYADELFTLRIQIVNSEAEAVDATINAHFSGEEGIVPSMKWSSGAVSPVLHDDPQDTSEVSLTRKMQTLPASASEELGILVTSPSDPLKTTLELVVDYTLSSDKSAPLRKSMTVDLDFKAALLAKFTFGPLLYPDVWPSYFEADGGANVEHPGGIPQLWRLGSQIRSLAVDRLTLHRVEIVLSSVTGDSQARIKATALDEVQILEPRQTTNSGFQLYTQKHSLDDRRPTAIESTLQITWSRDPGSEAVTTKIPVPRLTLPVSEPRVLSTLAENGSDDCDALLQYHIENPSNHFLTFALTMEASEEFAYSGPKYRALSLAPLSRHRVVYRIMLQDGTEMPGDANEEGRWIWPALQVIDSYYQKTLRVHPGGADVKLDEKGDIGVWIGNA